MTRLNLNAKERYDLELKECVGIYMKHAGTSTEIVPSELEGMVEMHDNGVPFFVYSIIGPSPDSFYLADILVQITDDVYLVHEDGRREAIKRAVS
jgi:hypothetical protein